METFKTYFLENHENVVINEVKDTKRNREDIIRSYGLRDHAPEHVAQERAKELIDKWTKLEPLINPDVDYFGNADSITGRGPYNPKDIFTWARVSKDFGWDKLEALQNLEAMMINLGRERDKKEQSKMSEKDYETLVDNEHATLYRPKSEAASCKLGANTKWCTAATKGPNQFESYMSQGVVLFYAILKGKKFNTATAVWPPQPASGGGRAPGSDFKSEEKYAIAMYPGGDIFEVYDQEDTRIDWDEWQEIAEAHDLPTDKIFYKKHGPNSVSVLKQSVNYARSVMSGQTERDPIGGESNWELLMDVLEKVKIIFKERDTDDLADYEKYRRDEGMPDEVFLMDVLNRSSMEYYTDREFNPAGSNNWANSQFQKEIVRNINRLTHLINQANGDDWSEEIIQDMDDLTNMVRGPFDGDEARMVFHQLRGYISRHMNDEWPELEKALLKHWEANHDAVNIKVTGGYSEHTDTPFQATYMWLRMLMDIKNGEWPELEQMIHKRIKSVLHAGDKDPDYKNKKNGIQSMGNSYNSAANFYRQVATTELRAWLPDSDDHFNRYMDGEWDIDGPPLTDRAMRERRYKGIK